MKTRHDRSSKAALEGQLKRRQAQCDANKRRARQIFGRRKSKKPRRAYHHSAKAFHARIECLVLDAMIRSISETGN